MVDQQRGGRAAAESAERAAAVQRAAVCLADLVF